MAGATTRLPPLYIAAWTLSGIGVCGLVCLLLLSPPAHIFRGLFFIFIGFIAFGTGETVNHPKPSPPARHPVGGPQQQCNRQRNSCSLGNLCDIGAVLLFFTGLSTLLFRG